MCKSRQIGVFYLHYSFFRYRGFPLRIDLIFSLMKICKKGKAHAGLPSVVDYSSGSLTS